MDDLTIYTCVTGEYDLLKKPEYGGNYLAYVDPYFEGNGWVTKQAPTLFKDNTRNARLCKLLSHQFVDTEWSLWIDGNMNFNVSPEEIFGKYKGNDITLFEAKEWHSPYIEGEKVIEMGKGDPKIVNDQMARYKEFGFPGEGLSVTGCILRHHTPKVIEFNNYWWSEMCRNSKRDQLSVDYVAWKLGIKLAYFEGNVFDNPNFFLVPHK